MEKNNMKKNNNASSNETPAEKKAPKVLADPYTAELHQIMSKSHISVDNVQRMSYLIETKGAKLNGIGQDGKTLLEKAVRHNSVELFQFLRTHGADVNQVNGKLETPLHVAARLKYASMREEILRASPNVNAQDASGKTPLLISVQENDAQGVSSLLAHKADPNIPAKGGEVPLTEVTDPQIGHELLQNGARVNVVTKDGVDPLTRAENLQDDKLMAEILEAKLKEEKHISDQNADVEHKDTTLDKENELANQSNGPVDPKIKEEQSEEKTEEKSETVEQKEDQGNSDTQVTTPESQVAQTEGQKEIAPEEKATTNEQKTAENSEQQEANANSVAAALDEEKRTNNSKGNEEDPYLKSFHAQVLAMKLGITAMPKDPEARASMIAKLEEQWAKSNTNERLSMALSFYATRSKKQAKTTDRSEKETKKSLQHDATLLKEYKKKQQNVA